VVPASGLTATSRPDAVASATSHPVRLFAAKLAGPPPRYGAGRQAATVEWAEQALEGQPVAGQRALQQVRRRCRDHADSAYPAPADRFARCRDALRSCSVDARAFVDEQIELLKQGDVSALLDQHYHPDAVLLNQRTSIRGRQALHAYFTDYLAVLGDLTVDSIDLLTAAGDAILFEATVTSAPGRVRVYDALVLREGRITHHFAGVIG
jgi:ketosteroid isomerase-like protein